MHLTAAATNFISLDKYWMTKYKILLLRFKEFEY